MYLLGGGRGRSRRGKQEGGGAGRKEKKVEGRGSGRKEKEKNGRRKVRTKGGEEKEVSVNVGEKKEKGSENVGGA